MTTMGAIAEATGHPSPCCAGTLEWQANTDEFVCRQCNTRYTSVELMHALSERTYIETGMEDAEDLRE